MKVKLEDLPFDEAIEYLRGKVPLPTDHWDDLMGGMHSRAFVIAGGMKTELLADMHKAVLDGLEKGTTLADFRKDFDSIVARHGWSYKGKRGWRTAVIFNTNLSTAYSAGHYKQMTDPDVMSARPYGRYIAGLSANPREEHLRWHDTVLPLSDPWFRTHWPPNGWGCKCMVASMSGRELERDGLRVSERPPLDMQEVIDPGTGAVYEVPKGIDPGWDYNPGVAAWGQRISDRAMSDWRAMGAEAFEPLIESDWQSYGLERRLRPDPTTARPDYTIPKTREGMEAYLTKMLGGEEKVFSFTDRYRPGFRHDVLVNAEALAAHLPADRAQFLPYLRESIEDPQEVWLMFERHKGTGKVVLRQRFIKVADAGKDRGMVLSVQAEGGKMEAWTAIPTTDLDYMNRQRSGRLAWKKD